MLEILSHVSVRWRYVGISLFIGTLFVMHIVFDLIWQIGRENTSLTHRLQGISCLELSNAQIYDIQYIRGLSYLALSGDQSVLPELSTRRVAVLGRFQQMLEASQSDVRSHRRLEVLMSRFLRVSSFLDSHQNVCCDSEEQKRTYQEYSELIEMLLNFNTYTNVVYKVFDGGEWHLNLLAELYSGRIPASIDIVAKLRDIMAGSIQSGHLSLEERESLRFHSHLLQYNRVAIDDILRNAYQNDFSLKKLMEADVKKVEDSNMATTLNIDRLLEEPLMARENCTRYFEEESARLQYMIRLVERINSVLVSENRLYTETKVQRLWSKVFTETLLMFMTLLLFKYYYRSNMEYIQKVEKAEKAKSAFLSHMSHEIRTPLNAILGFIELLKEKRLDTESREYVETIQKSSTMLLNIINDILDLSKIESGKMTIESVPFHPRKEFEPLLTLYGAMAKEKGSELVVLFASEVPECITSDPMRLKQIIANLVSNAVKFTPEKGRIEVKFGFNPTNRKLKVQVSDTGIGIPFVEQGKIFDAFTQADESTTRRYGGTGLGLAICARIISMMNGQIRLTSESGKGSVFDFEIPLVECTFCVPLYSDENWDQIKKLSSPTVQDTFSGKVLVVEDNETNRMFMGIVLKKLGLEFETAVDGLEAVEKFKTGDYDIVLMDENMPNMSGTDAAKAIIAFELDQKREHTPIIAITANALQGDREIFLEAGMDDYVSKPVDKEALRNIFKRFLKKEKLMNQSIKSFSLNKNGY